MPWISARVRSWTSARPSVRARSNAVWPMISRIALSAVLLSVPRGEAVFARFGAGPLGRLDRADRSRDVVVQARLGGRHPFAEDQGHALLLRLHAVEAADPP